ncbi:hypothetical protein [Defluviimonas sp. SAOS-178_SWC]|uniref:hypothetical protein n=1 Tax=Defluviimonas sp. SAOS-178_SWC TaxID=3121287 RepID=UPI003221712B
MSSQLGLFSLSAAALLAAPALAGGKFAPPAGCAAFATVQLRNCQVSQHYRCEHDAPGDQWAVYMDGDGPFYMSRIDAETRWLDSFDLVTGERDALLSETDPASFTTLITTGRDDYDFTTESNTGEVRRYTGFDQLTGEKTVIDGVVLERTKFDLTAWTAEGEMIWRRVGRQFIHRDWRLFWADTEDFENGFGDRDTVVDTPVAFAQPGDKGFLSSEPLYDCDMMMTDTPPHGERPRS